MGSIPTMSLKLNQHSSSWSHQIQVQAVKNIQTNKQRNSWFMNHQISGQSKASQGRLFLFVFDYNCSLLLAIAIIVANAAPLFHSTDCDSMTENERLKTIPRYRWMMDRSSCQVKNVKNKKQKKVDLWEIKKTSLQKQWNTVCANNTAVPKCRLCKI